VVTLHVEVRRPLRIREGRRITEDQIVLATILRQPADDVVLHQLMARRIGRVLMQVVAQGAARW